MFLSELTAGFLLDCRVRNLSQATLDTYSAALGLLCEYLEDPQSETVTLVDLRRYSLHLQDRRRYGAGNHPWMTATDRELSPWTVHQYLRPVKTLFAWAHAEGLHDNNAAARLQLPKLPRGRVDRFTDEQIDQLLDAARSVSYRDYAIAFLLLDSGLRRGELVALTLSDVDLRTGMITVRCGKGAKWRQVRIGDACRKVLWTYTNRYRAPATDSELSLFVSDTGGPVTGNALGCLFARLSKVLGFRIYAHKFRHTFATNLARQVPNAFLVAQALGHSDLNTAAIYVHLAEGETATASPMDAHIKRS